MLEARHYTAAGAAKKSAFALPEDLFDGAVNEPTLHQAVKTFLGNQRQGTAKTKTRSFVSGGNQKPWKQKGTGRARQGSTRAPHWRGGGTVFGPQPRDYRTDIPRKVRQLARRSALNARAREGAMLVIERLAFDAPKTKQFAGLLASMGVADQKVLVLTNGHHPNAYLSGRNVPNARILPWSDASPYDVIWADAVVVEEGALTGQAPAAGDEGEEAPAKATKAKAPKAKATKAVARPKAAKKAAASKAKKPAAKKAAPKKTKGAD